MAIKDSIKQSQINPSDMVEFYHISRNPDFMKSFLNRGARTIGKGQGGQADGFYVWTGKEGAKKHIGFLSDEFSQDAGLLVGVRIPKALIQYPDWQFDYEKCGNLQPLFEKYENEILALKKFPVQIGNTSATLSIKQHPHEIKGAFYCNVVPEGAEFGYSVGVIASDDQRVGDNILALQGICDKLCQNNKEFRRDYNQLLQNEIALGKRPLKYTGEKTLPISHLSLIQGDQKGKFEETVLYTDQKPKEKQVCPFVTAGLKIKASQKQ